MTESQKILEHFSGSDLEDSFHKLIRDAGVPLSDRERRLAEVFYFAGASTTFSLQDKAWKIAEHVGMSLEEKAELYEAACLRLQEEITTHGTERMIQALLNILRKAQK
jgi:hypothetical protein